MKTLFALGFFASSAFAFAQEPVAPASEPAATPNPEIKPAKQKVVFKPRPIAGTFERKDGDGASRGDHLTLPDGRTIELPNLFVLTPKKGVALTTKARPSLFTFQTHEVPYPIEYRVTINRPPQPYPIFVQAKFSSASGFQRLSLADTAIDLEPGVEYEWNVVFRVDNSKKAADLDAKGLIKRIVPDAALAAKIEKATPAELPAIYAEAGIWYDALEAIANQLAANPKDPDWLAARKNMLDAAGLTLVEKPSKPPEKPKKPVNPDLHINFTPAPPNSPRRTNGDNASRSEAL